MDDVINVITRAEHEEFSRRIEAEETRQNKRLDILEEAVRQNGELTVSVGKLATNMENMLKEQENQGIRLEKLESHDGEMWRKVILCVVTALCTAIVTYAMTQIGL